MNIIKEKWLFLNATVFHAPKQIRKLYAFGISVIAAQNVVSLRANARLAGLRWPTAKSKIWRLTKNARLISAFTEIAAACAPVFPDDVVAVDFSDFGNNFQVLMFAKETQQGRAIPLYFDVLRYPVAENSQNTFVIEATKEFKRIFGCTPTLVFDRGFACPSIIRFLKEQQWKFVIRVKAGKHFRDRDRYGEFAARHAAMNDQNVFAYDTDVRLIVSDEQDGIAEPWYLITNDVSSPRETIIERYYHRFEIEEFFRDTKRLLGLEWVSWKTETSLAVTLWFVILGVWCLAHLMVQLDRRAKAAHDMLRQKMRLSETRYVFELLRNAVYHVAEGQFLNLHDV